MNLIQHIRLNKILDELEIDYGYGPSFEISVQADVKDVVKLIKEDFHNYKISIITELNESNTNMLRRLDEL